MPWLATHRGWLHDDGRWRAIALPAQVDLRAATAGNRSGRARMSAWAACRILRS